MSWLQKVMPSQIRTDVADKRSIPEGLWTKCEGCGAVLYRAELERTLNVCPKCGTHHYISARQRIDSFLDPDGRSEIAPSLEAVDMLKFRDTKKYRDRLAQAQKDTAEKDALVVMQGQLNGLGVVVAAFEFGFMGGSMGAVVGEKFVRGVNICIAQGHPLVCFAASGGARMQESLFSLMQMARTSAALGRLANRGLPFISVMTNSTMGGVS